MEKGNVLVIGNSGVGKSTLINSILGEDCAKIGWVLRVLQRNCKYMKMNQKHVGTLAETKNHLVAFEYSDTWIGSDL